MHLIIIDDAYNEGLFYNRKKLKVKEKGKRYGIIRD